MTNSMDVEGTSDWFHAFSKTLKKPSFFQHDAKFQITFPFDITACKILNLIVLKQNVYKKALNWPILGIKNRHSAWNWSFENEDDCKV